MKPRVKLLTLWFGDLPEWYPQFQERMAANRIVEHKLVCLDSLARGNQMVQAHALTPCNKATPYAFSCDVRPLLGDVYATEYAGFDFWGWCDLDIVVGDLDRLLTPLLDLYDVISGDAANTAGPFTILRNTPETRSLYHRGDYAAVLAEPSYCNFDENGFADDLPNDNPNFTRIVNESGLRVLYDGRTWAESHDMLPEGIPSRCCDLREGRLIEIPTGRELLYYHFAAKYGYRGETTGYRQWPLPNRFANRIGLQRRHWRYPPPKIVTVPSPVPDEGVESPEYWRKRLQNVLSHRKETHRISYDTPIGDWLTIQEHTGEVLRRHIQSGDRLLDVGCGFGGIYAVAHATGLGVQYTGVDLSPDIVEFARRYWAGSSVEFVCSGYRSLPFEDDTFPWAVCRGLEGSIRSTVGNADWGVMQTEMLRVARRLILINLQREYRIVERGSV